VTFSLKVDAQTVYKTSTGKKYHVKGHYDNSTPISLSKARELGLGPCAVCKPTTTADPNSNSNTSNLIQAEPQPKIVQIPRVSPNSVKERPRLTNVVSE
jgi:hypothetical protein